MVSELYKYQNAGSTIKKIMNYFYFYFFKHSSPGKPFKIKFTDLNEHKILHDVYEFTVNCKFPFSFV